MNRKSILLALVAAASITGVADAQSKYYMRSKIAPSVAKASTPSCGLPVQGTWIVQKPNSPAASAVATGPGFLTVQEAQAWCNRQPGITSENTCLWVQGNVTYLAINAVPAPGYPNSQAAASCQ